MTERNKKVIPAQRKPITTSMSTLSFRFNAEDEELEELYCSPIEDQEEAFDAQEDQSSSRFTTHITTSTSSEHSPMKENFQKLSKRSSSLDENPGSSDTWRLLHELKGKITKTVEEKLSEIKNEKKTESQKLVRSKENSSISDSEECTGIEKALQDDSSPIDLVTIPTTPESTTPEPELHHLNVAQVEINKLTSSNVKRSPHKIMLKAAELTIQNKIRPKLNELRQRGKKLSNFEGSVSMSGVQDDCDDIFDVIDEEGVDSAVEIEEDDTKKFDHVTAHVPPSWNIGLLCKQYDVQALLLWPIFCALLPLPSTIRDLVLGALFMHILHRVHKWLFQKGSNALEKPFQIPDYSTMPILQVPSVHEYQHLHKYEGWMNELPYDYNPESYHINQTRSVFMRLEGSLLRISLSRQKIRKRAMWNEPSPRLSFYHQRIFDISGCPITLLPDGLARKRLWSKKYPICIVLHQGSRIGMSIPETFKEVIDEDDEEDEAESSVQEENSEEEAFYLVTSSMVEQNQLFLFARTDREKDDWMRRLVAASKTCSVPTPRVLLTPLREQEELETQESQPQIAVEPPVVSLESELYRHLNRFLQQHDASEEQGLDKNILQNQQKDDVCTKDSEPAWFNALLSRVLFDVVRDSQWSEWVRDRIQRKLSTIKELTVSELDLGVALPVVHRTSAPYMDERGLWIDLDVSYEGSASISVETKLNLVKLTKSDSIESSSGSNKEASSNVQSLSSSRSPMFDSDMEDSAESSSDEGTQEGSADDSTPATGSSGGSMGKMLFRMATKITTSRYFQQASEIRYIRRAMEEMSNTKVMVNVELKGLVGVLAVNIPPPPSDRLWYGFRGNPELRLAAKAKLGERLVTLSQVTDWIEGKLCVEFQKVFVLPNMDELIIPVMNSKLPK